MATCTGCGTTNSSVLRPNLSCPPDLSQLLFRFIERKSLGIVKGTTTLASTDMSKFFLPLGNYMQGNILLCGDTPKRIEAGSSMDFGERREIQEFDITGIVGAGVTATLNVTEGTTDHGTLTGIAADTYTDFITNLKAAISGNTTIAAQIEFNTDDLSAIFSLRGKTYGDAFTYTLTFSTVGVVAGTVTQTAKRYPLGAWKLIMLSIVFCDSCVGSNKQIIEYAYDADVQANTITGATWRKLGPMIILTGGEDLIETDTNKLETLWVRNVGDCDVEIQTILGI
jgi:hypothetical protein